MIISENMEKALKDKEQEIKKLINQTNPMRLINTHYERVLKKYDKKIAEQRNKINALKDEIRKISKNEFGLNEEMENDDQPRLDLDEAKNLKNDEMKFDQLVEVKECDNCMELLAVHIRTDVALDTLRNFPGKIIFITVLMGFMLYFWYTERYKERCENFGLCYWK